MCSRNWIGSAALVTLRATEARGDAEAIARTANPAAFDIVAAAGGDGTINEVINGLAQSPLPLALISLGTANVLANEIGLAPRRRRARHRGRPRRAPPISAKPTGGGSR